MDVFHLPRVVIEQISPIVDGGRYPIKRLVGERIDVGAVIYKDGHDLITAEVRARYKGGGPEQLHGLAKMTHDFNADHWSAVLSLERIGRWEMWIEAWPDYFGTWARDLKKRIDAGQYIEPELLEGAALVRRRAKIAPGSELLPLENAAKALSDSEMDMELRTRVAFSQTLADLMYGPIEVEDVAISARYPVQVDRSEAGFAAWYELFPRSEGSEPGRHGTFKDVERRIPEIAAMGFEVIYLPPIHPIGKINRKGRNNAVQAQPGDVGSPWAIGSDEGGHTAIHPELGSLSDFRSLVGACRDYGLEVAIDIAFQCAPDHPWVTEHPSWFFVRPDGSLRYAENPPKKYEDIYPINFWTKDTQALWEACRDVMLYWVDQGVKTFRVDNPHTKPLAFWEWAIGEIQALHPDVVFLSESFTRPNRMKGLAKLGFTQSYTYFTWKNSKQELSDYMIELTQTEMAEYYRPNFFANTPDILHEYLQDGGRPAFRIRLLLAATLSPVYGIYSGYELCENLAVRPGSEEYLDSEKYEIKSRDWSAPGNLKRDIARLNAIRGTEPALAQLTNLVLCDNNNPELFSYLKRDDVSGQGRHLLGVVNLNPHEVREGMVSVPLDALGLTAEAEYDVKDLLTGATYTWRGSKNYVRLDPQEQVGHLFRILPRA